MHDAGGAARASAGQVPERVTKFGRNERGSLPGAKPARSHRGCTYVQ
jgi:hypothetical protein